MNKIKFFGIFLMLVFLIGCSKNSEPNLNQNIKNQFADEINHIKKISDEKYLDLLNKAKESGELLYIGNTQMEMNQGMPKELQFAITNNGSLSHNYSIVFECEEKIGGSCPEIDRWFWMYSNIEIKSNETKGIPVIITGSETGNYMFKAILNQDNVSITEKRLFLEIK